MAFHIVSREEYPVDDLIVDLIAIAFAKSSALEVYDRYLSSRTQSDDSIVELLDRMRRQEDTFIVEIQEQLGRLIAQAPPNHV